MRKIAIPLLLLLVQGCVAVGPTYSVYTDSRVQSQEGLRATVGQKVYAWASYDDPDVDLVGQPLGNMETIGAGLGARYDMQDNEGLFVFAEFGHYWVDLEPADRIRNEVVVTALENNHGEIPFTPKETLYNMDDAWGTRVGVGWKLSRWSEVSVAWRSLSLREGYDALSTPGECIDTGPATCWQDRTNLDASSIELHLMITF